MQLKQVDLPAPLGPIIASSSPFCRLKSTPGERLHTAEGPGQARDLQNAHRPGSSRPSRVNTALAEPAMPSGMAMHTPMMIRPNTARQNSKVDSRSSSTTKVKAPTTGPTSVCARHR